MSRRNDVRASLRGLLALGLFLLVLAPTAAVAKPDRIELSSDGRTWQASLSNPLFAGLGEIVPLDEATRTFEVRNSSRVPARATVELVDASDATSQLQQHLRISAAMGSISGSNLLGQVGNERCKTVVTGPTLQPGETQQVDVAIAFDDVDGLTAQSSEAVATLRVSLRQVNASGAVTICGAQAEAEPYEPCAPGQVAVLRPLGKPDGCREVIAGVESELPDTGAPASLLGRIAAAAALMGVGSLMMVLGRRRRSASPATATGH